MFCIHCRSEIDPKFKACPYCAEPITDLLRRYHDTPIDGKYTILSCLGVGGMGEGYKVLHVHLTAIRVIQVMLGHKKLETTALYAQVATDLLREVISPLERLPTA